MVGLITQKTNKSVAEYLDTLDESKRTDAKKIIQMMKKTTGANPAIWGTGFIIGFGDIKYQRKNGKEEFDWFQMGFAPRKDKISVYLTCDIFKEEETLKKLGNCKWSKGCLYIKKLEDVDLKVLEKLINKFKDAVWV